MDKDGKAELLVVDDHSLVLEGICRVLAEVPGVVVAASTTSGKEALELARRHEFDLYVLDISLPDLSGFDLIVRIRDLYPEARIIVNTMYEEIWMVNRLVQCHVNAILLKASASSELLKAVQAVLRGEYYTCPRFASILQKLTRTSSDWQVADQPTKRERDVLQAVAKGLNTHEIAALLGISENTVETFRKRLMAKFGARNAIDMVVKAVAKGWVTVD